MHSVNSSRAFPKSSFQAKRALALAAAAGVSILVSGSQRGAHAASFYWSGDHDTNWNTTGGLAGTNWSNSAASNNDPQTLPGSSDDVYFAVAGAGNLNTSLGQNFTINSLNFTSNALASNQITIGGANTLTIGAGGIVDNSSNAPILVSTNLAVGADQIWENNTTQPITFSGIISGSAGLALEGTGALTGTATGGFVFSAANSYSGQILLGNTQTSLTLNGNGSFASVTNPNLGFVLGAANSLILDNTGTNSSTRLASTVGIGSSGGTLSLLGNASAATTQTVGTLTIGAGLTNVNVTPGSGQTATLTFGSATVNSFSRVSGGAINFSDTANGTIAAPKVALDTGGLIGGWATIGNLNSSSGTNLLDFATVSGGNVTAVSNYVNHNTNAAFVTGNNVKLSGQVTLTNVRQTIDSLYLTGASQLNFGTGTTGTAQLTNTLVITSGAIISNAATLTTGFNNQPNFSTIALIGSSVVNANAGSGGPSYQGIITSGNGSDLIVDTASNLQIDAIIANNGSTQIGLTKNGSGILDLSDGNNQSQPGTGEIHNTFTGSVTINGGILLTNDDLNLGAVTSYLNYEAIVLNGGTLETTKGYTLNSNRGITVGPQGGTLAYIGGATWTLGGGSSSISGPGSVTFSSIPGGFTGTDTNTINLNYGSGLNNYSGATILNTQYSGTATYTANISISNANEFPATSPLTITGNAGGGGDNFNNTNQIIGSLSSAQGVGNLTNIGAFNVGGNNSSTSYGGLIGGASGSFTKTGTGTQTLAGTGSYTGATYVSGGTLMINGALNGTSSVMVSGGTLAGGGSITSSGGVTISSLGTLSPDNSQGSTMTLKIVGGLTLKAGATLAYDFGAAGSPGTSDLVNVTSSGTLASGTDVLDITQLSGFGIGTYDLISAGTLTDNATFTINASNNFNYAVAKSGNLLVLTVTTGNPNLFWTGAANGSANGNWDTATTNWTSTSAGSVYSDGANVTFDDGDLSSSPAGATSVAVQSSGVLPNSVTFNNGSNNYTFSGGSITASLFITKSQVGSVTFNNSVTTPLTTMNAGTLTVDSTGTLNSTTSVSVSGGTLAVNGSLTTPALTTSSSGAMTVGSAGTLSVGTLTLNGSGGATFNNAAQMVTNLTGSGPLALNGTALTIGSGGTYSGTITDSGSGGSIVAAANSTVILSADNTYSGGTTIGSAATLQVGAGGFTGTLGTGPITDNGMLIFNRVVFGLNVASAITGSGGLIQNGTGTTTLSGTNTYTGVTTLSAGVINLGVAENVGVSGPLGASAANNAGSIVLNGGYLQYSSNNTNDYSGRFSTAANQQYNVDTNGQNVTWAGALTSSNGSVSKKGNGTLTLTGSNSYSGGTTIMAGTLQVGSPTALGASSGSVDVVYGAALDLNGTAMTNANLLYLNSLGINNSGGGLNNSSSTPAAYAGQVRLVAAGSIAASGGNITLTNAISGGGNLTLDGSNNGTVAGIIATTSGGLTKVGTGTWTLSGANTYTGTTEVSGGTLTLSSSATGSSGTLGASTNPLDVSNANYNAAGNAVVLNLPTNIATVTGNLTGIVVTPTSGTNTATINLGAGLIVGETSSTTYAGTLAGSGNFLLDGQSTGTLTVTGSNTYSGGTYVSVGTLLADNTTGSATGSGNVHVLTNFQSPYAPGKLGGNGTIAGTVTLSGSYTAKQGGIIAAGANSSTTGTLTTGAETWMGGAVYQWKMAATGTAGQTIGSGGSGTPGTTATWDDLSMSGLTFQTLGGSNTPVTLALSNTATLTSSSGQYSWIIAHSSSVPSLPSGVAVGDDLLTQPVSGGNNPLFALDTSTFTFNGVTAPSPSLFSLEFMPDGNGGDNLILDYDAVPEPGVAYLTLAGVSPLLMRRRRRRGSAAATSNSQW